MMKNIIIALLLLAAAITTYADEASSKQADKFVGFYLNQFENPERQFTQEQKDALRTAQPLLALVPQDKVYRNYFWYNLRGIKRTVSWDEAAQMIRTGEVREASQNHDLTVVLLTYSGEMLYTTAPAINTAYKVIEEVDPKHVFIRYSTE